MTIWSSAADQQEAQGLSVARGGIEQRPEVHPDRRGLPAAQRRQLRGPRRCSPGHVGRHVAACREVLLVVQEREVGGATPEEVALEVPWDHQHTVHLLARVSPTARPPGPRRDRPAARCGSPGASVPRRGTSRSGRDRAPPPAGREPPRPRTRPPATGSVAAGMGPSSDQSTGRPRRRRSSRRATAVSAAHRRALVGHCTSALIPGRSAGSGWTGRARTSKVRTSKPPASRVARQVAKAPSGEM